ncbi:secretory protein [Salegentibacter salinarum]|uniref:Secretory protein n=1 Tax=Salegentibacter salinarum TaxID=447422 RepID=A0A2N0TNW4_9FLAO|nr:basic secretory protein-like protein [Salegentibacter salinarum]PKD16398.1 secretory protein [Salegentibacter salinarum]SKB63629.1 Peptidase [Salegentibacter salinarum]
MKNNYILIGLFTIFMVSELHAQRPEVFQEKDKTLIFTNDDPLLDKEVKSGLIKTFFKVYPELVRDFNSEVSDTIYVKIDTSYSGVAYAHNGKITISSQWLKKKPNDLDVITHEAMHIVQSYPHKAGPGWLTEGIADYVRYKYGVNNEDAEWFLPDYSAGQSYKNSYRITARFLAWISNNYNRNLVVTLDRNMRENTYSEILWKEITGNTLEELWEAYAENPDISKK